MMEDEDALLEDDGTYISLGDEELNEDELLGIMEEDTDEFTTDELSSKDGANDHIEDDEDDYEDDDDEESEEKKDRRARFTSERSNTITTIGSGVKRAAIPDKLEVSAEDQKDIDKFFEKSNQRQRKNNPRRGRGRHNNNARLQGANRQRPQRFGTLMQQQQQQRQQHVPRFPLTMQPPLLREQPQALHLNPHFQGSVPVQPGLMFQTPSSLSFTGRPLEMMTPTSSAMFQPNQGISGWIGSGDDDFVQKQMIPELASFRPSLMQQPLASRPNFPQRPVIQPFDQHGRNNNQVQPPRHQVQQPPRHQVQQPARHQVQQPARHQVQQPARHQGPRYQGPQPLLNQANSQRQPRQQVPRPLIPRPQSQVQHISPMKRVQPIQTVPGGNPPKQAKAAAKTTKQTSANVKPVVRDRLKPPPCLSGSQTTAKQILGKAKTQAINRVQLEKKVPVAMGSVLQKIAQNKAKLISQSAEKLKKAEETILKKSLPKSGAKRQSDDFNSPSSTKVPKDDGALSAQAENALQQEYERQLQKQKEAREQVMKIKELARQTAAENKRKELEKAAKQTVQGNEASDSTSKKQMEKKAQNNKSAEVSQVKQKAGEKNFVPGPRHAGPRHRLPANQQLHQNNAGHRHQKPNQNQYHANFQRHAGAPPARGMRPEQQQHHPPRPAPPGQQGPQFRSPHPNNFPARGPQYPTSQQQQYNTPPVQQPLRYATSSQEMLLHESSSSNVPQPFSNEYPSNQQYPPFLPRGHSQPNSSIQGPMENLTRPHNAMASMYSVTPMPARPNLYRGSSPQQNPDMSSFVQPSKPHHPGNTSHSPHTPANARGSTVSPSGAPYDSHHTEYENMQPPSNRRVVLPTSQQHTQNRQFDLTRSRKVRINNLASNVSFSQLSQLVETIAPPMNIEIQSKFERGFILFENFELANLFVDSYDGYILNNVRIDLSKSPE